MNHCTADNSKHSAVAIVTADAATAARILASRPAEIAAFADCQIPAGAAELQTILQSLPITNKQFYRDHGARAYLEPDRSTLLFAETSGTSGSAPLLTPRGRADLNWNTHNQAHAYRRNLRPGHDRVMLLNPSVMSPFIEGSARALFDLGIAHMRAYPIAKVCDWKRLGRLINDYGISAVMSTPTLVLKLLFELHRHGIEVPSLDKFLLTGEHLSRHMLQGIDALLGRTGASRPLVYGSSEAATVMYGLHNGDYMAYTEDFVFEILPLDAPWLDALKAGLPENAQTGRLAISWLRRGIMNLLRFDTGDLFSCWPDEQHKTHIFRSHGRANTAGLSPLVVDEIEQIMWAGEQTCGRVVHYDIALGAHRAEVNIITKHCAELSDLDALTAQLTAALHRHTTLLLNTREHSFFEQSPQLKSSRFNTR